MITVINLGDLVEVRRNGMLVKSWDISGDHPVGADQAMDLARAYADGLAHGLRAAAADLNAFAATQLRTAVQERKMPWSGPAPAVDYSDMERRIAARELPGISKSGDLFTVAYGRQPPRMAKGLDDPGDDKA